MGKNVIVAKQNVTVAKKVANVATVLPAGINVLAGINAPVATNVLATSLKQEKNANAKKDAKLNNIASTQ